MMDPLSDVLRMVRLDGTYFYAVEAAGDEVVGRVLAVIHGRPDHSGAAAAAIRALGDAQLDQAAPVSLNAESPQTCQFMLEDHAVRHSHHHLDRIRTALQR